MPITRKALEKLLDENGVREDDTLIICTKVDSYMTIFTDMADIEKAGWEDDDSGGFYFYIDLVQN